MNNSKCLISIIIPAYNAEHTIIKAIESIYSGNYEIDNEIQTIVVDDGSIDNTYNICIKYETIYNNFIVVSQENMGVSLARKAGLKRSEGNFILFLDADDYFEPDACQFVINFISQNDYDVVEFNYQTITLDNTLLTQDLKEEELYDHDIELCYAKDKYNMTNYVCNKIYKREIFKKIEFPPLRMGEDSCVLTQIMYYARNYKRINKILYNYVQNIYSLCHQTQVELKLDNVKAGEFMAEFNQIHAPELVPYSYVFILDYCISLQMFIKKNKISCEYIYIPYLKYIFKKYYIQLIDMQNMKNTPFFKKAYVRYNIYKILGLSCYSFFKKINHTIH